MSMDYDEIREEAQSSGRRIDELLALSRGADPFSVEMPARVRDGRWFASIWRALNVSHGIHLRRLHYQLVSGTSRWQCPDGTPYENTTKCWELLCIASRNARQLRLVDPTAFEDHRSPDPRLYATSRPTPTPAWAIDAMDLPWRQDPALPSLDPSVVALSVDVEIPTPEVSGYDFSEADQPYHLEVWIEKSTMDDVLEPICQRYGVTLQTGVGYLSITRVIEMLRRVADHEKPARIFYISDFDPSGVGMPIHVARTSEYFMARYAPSAELKLTPLALTAAQVAQYRLPRTPIKWDHTGRINFEARHGSGAVELDALEGVYPGELARLLEEAIEPYIDDELEQRLGEAEEEAAQAVEDAWNDATETERGELEEIAAEAETILAPYREQLETLSAEVNTQLAPLNERLQSSWQALRAKRTELDVPLPERPEPEVDPDVEMAEWDWLFDSDREYFNQIDHYKDQRPDPEPVKRAYSIACKGCEKPCTVYRKDSAYCSEACRTEHHRARYLRGPIPARACAICGAMFQPIKVTATLCSDRCRQAASTRARTERRQAAPPETRPSRFPPIPCEICGTTFTPLRGNVRVCSPRCKSRARANDQRRARAERRQSAS